MLLSLLYVLISGIALPVGGIQMQYLWRNQLGDVYSMGLGSAAAFMLTGPATKITNLGALKIAMGWTRFLMYLAFVMLFSFLCGMAVNLFCP